MERLVYNFNVFQVLLSLLTILTAILYETAVSSEESNDVMPTSLRVGILMNIFLLANATLGINRNVRSKKNYFAVKCCFDVWLICWWCVGLRNYYEYVTNYINSADESYRVHILPISYKVSSWDILSEDMQWRCRFFFLFYSFSVCQLIVLVLSVFCFIIASVRGDDCIKPNRESIKTLNNNDTAKNGF